MGGRSLPGPPAAPLWSRAVGLAKSVPPMALRALHVHVVPAATFVMSCILVLLVAIILNAAWNGGAAHSRYGHRRVY